RAHAPIKLVVKHHRRRASAVTQAINRLEREIAVARSLAKLDTEASAHVLCQRHRAHRLARLRAAQPNHIAAGRLMAKIVIESDNPVNLGAREIERMSDYRHAVARHVAEA